MSDSPSPPKRRILVVDSQPLFRDGVRHWLEQQKDLACCGQTEGGAAVAKLVASQKPDLVLMDVRLNADDDFTLIRSLRAQFPAVFVLAISQNDEMVFGDRALSAGAHGYLMKECQAGELLAAIRTILEGEIHVSQPLGALMLKKLWHGDASGDRTHVLSNRELQVFQLVGSGIGTREIARRLSVSVKTIESHREHIKRKLALKNAASLAHAATVWVGSNARLPSPRA